MTWGDSVVLYVIAIVFMSDITVVLALWFIDQMREEKRKDSDS